MGYCYGRIVAIETGYRQLSRYQQQLTDEECLKTARMIVQAKLKNSRILLIRHQRRHGSEAIKSIIQTLAHLAEQCQQADSIPRLMGIEGIGAASYFQGFGDCLIHDDFIFTARSRRPPGNPVNAMLSFGYQVLWNHLLSLIELKGLDPYFACLHQGGYRHAALASDLIEEFRAAIVDSLTLYLINRKLVDPVQDFEFRDGGCFLNERGRKIYLRAFLMRMEESLEAADQSSQPRWHCLSVQVDTYKRFVYQPVDGYKPYLIR